MARRLPPWVLILAFAVIVGGGVGLAAYLRGRGTASFCTAKLPSAALLAKLTGRTYRAETRSGCTTHFVANGRRELAVTRRTGDYMTRLRELERELQLVSETIAADPPTKAAILETTVQATAAKRVGLIGKRDDLVELHFDPAVFGKDQALEVMREIATR